MKVTVRYLTSEQPKGAKKSGNDTFTQLFRNSPQHIYTVTQEHNDT